MAKQHRSFPRGAIGKRVDKAMEQLSFNDLEEALLHACIAVGATSKREFGHVKRDNEAYKGFLRKNIQLVFLVTTCGQMGVTSPNIRFGVKDGAVRTSEDGTASLEAILYHMVRCSLLHNSAMPKDFTLTSREAKGWQMGSGDNGVLTMPWQIIVGLILAVVGSPKNAYERTERNWQVMGADLNELWGEKRKIIELFVEEAAAELLMGEIEQE